MPQFERQGSTSEVYTKRYPDITGGVCDFCGVITGLEPSEVQYQITHVANCPYSAIGGVPFIRCSYCPDNVDPVEVIKRARLSVHQHPDHPNQLIAVCDSYNCSQKHLQRFKRN